MTSPVEVLGTTFVRGALGCPPSEYPVGDKCCPKCDPGAFAKRNCTDTRTTTCSLCDEGTFTSDYNGEIECFACTVCSPDLGLKTLTPCTVVQDTTCEPLDGFFCINRTENHCTAAQNHTRCQPGQYIRNNGTAATDTECSDCTSGTFSDGTFTVCRPHTQCEHRSLSTVTEGTTSTDAQCGKNNVPAVFLIGSLILFILIVGDIVVVQWRKKKRKVKEFIDHACCFQECTAENKKNYEEQERNETEGQSLKDETSGVTNHSDIVLNNTEVTLSCESMRPEERFWTAGQTGEEGRLCGWLGAGDPDISCREKDSLQAAVNHGHQSPTYTAPSQNVQVQGRLLSLSWSTDRLRTSFVPGAIQNFNTTTSLEQR
ncbi:tumor necrosis factor receptor superfamily member 14-like isoform X2 [Cynoglossus semilaevis]|uniref:tumor necrosis factor receptor superfamily member 14-like isoform X2 n=1 Tax=Cynoglossus semilaevis TaxID=244447 RepID=UPI000D62903D|nr:tumor necrosis factor receptor superfamily member 14-like isoform X2 [Cynoglossus semilaevis]XP_024915161.1 tumor necrosis factor receptor superfamily member 14-like isoform X2 [Cynoglossus semilaevis]